MLSGSRHLEGFQCLATDAGVHEPTNRFALGDDIVQGRNETADISRLVIILTTAVEFDGYGVTFGGDVVDSGGVELSDHDVTFGCV